MKIKESEKMDIYLDLAREQEKTIELGDGDTYSTLCTGNGSQRVGWLVGWVYGISIYVGYLMPNPFLNK